MGLSIKMCRLLWKTPRTEQNRQATKCTELYLFEDIALVEFMYLVFTRMPGESYHKRLRSLLLYLCYVYRALIDSLVC